MKKTGRALATILLLFVLSNAAFAGQMDTPPAPPTGQGQMDTPPAPPTGGGQMDTPPAAAVVGEVTVTSDVLSEIVLDIWRFIPSLF